MILSLSAMAQKDYSKKVKTKYISLPSYNISEIDPALVSIEFAMKNGLFGTEKLRTAESLCIPSGGGLTDVITVPTHYFDIPYTQPESYIIAKSTDGKVVYADKSSNTKPSSLRFGWDSKTKQALCEYFMVDKLKKDFKSKGASFKAKGHSNYRKSVYEKALEKAKARVYLSYFSEDFKVYSAKGKVYEYADLDGAFDKAMSAYKSIQKNGLNSNDIAQLKEAIAVWEKELESINLEDKKARINKSIGKALHENCIRAYLYIFDFENAKSHTNSFLKLFGVFSNNRSVAIKDLLVRIKLQAMAAKINTAIIKDVQKLHTMASAASKKMNAKLLSSGEFDRLADEYSGYNTTVSVNVFMQDVVDESDAIANGSLNPYQKFYSAIAAGGPAMLLSFAPSVLSNIPVLKELPKEMCEFEDLAQIVILNNRIETITTDITKLKSLKKIDLSGNNLKTLPAEIGQLTNLKTLKLSNNPLESIPAEIANCTTLSSLVIKGTKLSAEAIAELNRLLPDCKIKY